MAVCISGKDRHFTLQIHNEQIGYECQEPDPLWLFVDDEGHQHRWLHKGKEWSVPTTEYRERLEWFFGDDEGEPYQVSLGSYHCKRCGQEVQAGYCRKHQVMPGLTEWDGSFECTTDEASTLQAMMVSGTIEIGDWNSEGLKGTAIVTAVLLCDYATPFTPMTPIVEFHGCSELTYSPDEIQERI